MASGPEGHPRGGHTSQIRGQLLLNWLVTPAAGWRLPPDQGGLRRPLAHQVCGGLESFQPTLHQRPHNGTLGLVYTVSLFPFVSLCVSCHRLQMIKLNVISQIPPSSDLVISGLNSKILSLGCKLLVGPSFVLKQNPAPQSPSVLGKSGWSPEALSNW